MQGLPIVLAADILTTTSKKKAHPAFASSKARMRPSGRPPKTLCGTGSAADACVIWGGQEACSPSTRAGAASLAAFMSGDEMTGPAV